MRSNRLHFARDFAGHHRDPDLVRAITYRDAALIASRWPQPVAVRPLRRAMALYARRAIATARRREEVPQWP